MALPYQFANVSTLATPELDVNFNTVARLAPIPCAFSGTDTLTLTPLANTPQLTAYANYMQFTGVCANTNTGAATGAVGALGALPIFKDSIDGPVALTGGEMISLSTVNLMYDSTLNTGNGGFHLINQTAIGAAGGEAFGYVQFTGGFGVGAGDVATVTNLVSLSRSVSWPALNPQVSSIAEIPLTDASVGDCVIIGPYVSVPIGIIFSGYVSSAGTVTMMASNVSASTITPVAGDYRIAAWRIVA